MTTSSASPSFAARRDWLALLAGMPRDELERSLEQALAGAPAPGYDWLRPPETGLAMVRGRIGGTGDPFNLGEASVTRAVLRLAHDGAPTVLGIAYQLGRDKRRAELAALADALLQLPAYRARVEAQVIAPYRARLAQRRAARARDAAATRVEFFTMVRGE